ncbi:hypothetical protein EXE58_11860 [Nocardioides seonyuensis]|uniref:DUF7674 domain-containing protein n=1 Tax=Nocardioides seonyuensis TaxID=2518371 RepID=A0A4P7IJP1_9ACTN|nr:hypothetical protein [Nocardioides seonyuensis]QBX56091.1 hypothetical protein EXE58_11860 [Nocardioides seonyuensis]
MTANEDLMLRVVEAFPELRPLLTEHLDDQEGELLPYLLMADIERWSETQVTGNAHRISELMTWFENAFSAGGEEIKDLIGVGFVEMLPHTPEGDPILRLLGPELREVASDMGLFTPAERN